MWRGWRGLVDRFVGIVGVGPTTTQGGQGEPAPTLVCHLLLNWGLLVAIFHLGNVKFGEKKIVGGGFLWLHEFFQKSYIYEKYIV